MLKLNWNKKKTAATILLIAILVSAVAFWQTNKNVQAALINPHPGLVGWWNFNEGSGNVAGDSSGSGINGTVYGATWVAGKYGNALNFVGSSSYVDLGSSTVLECSPITISAWVKTSFSGGLQDIFRWRLSGVELGLSSGTPFLVVYDSAAVTYTIQASKNVADGAFHQIVGVYSGAGMSIYVDGNLIASSSAGVLYYGGGSAAIGRAGNYNGNYFNGIIDEVRIYNRALSHSEIQADFNAGPDSSANVLAKVPKGTTQVITTLTWQGTGNMDLTIKSPSQEYTENMLNKYQKSSYSTINGITSLLNIKRLSVSVTALPNDQEWYMMLEFDKVDDYQITVEIQK